jgi:hypothetical protein
MGPTPCRFHIFITLVFGLVFFAACPADVAVIPSAIPCADETDCPESQICADGYCTVVHENGGPAPVEDAGTSPTDGGTIPDSGMGNEAGLPLDSGPGTDSGFGGDGGRQADAGNALDAGQTRDSGSAMEAGPRSDAGENADSGFGSDSGSPFDSGPRRDAAVIVDAATPLDGGIDAGLDSGIDSGLDGGSDDAGAPSGFAWRRGINISPTRLGGETLTGFPVGIALVDSTMTGQMRTDGRDLVVTLPDGVTQLDYELEIFDRPSGEMALWVRLPALSGNARVFMYWGDATHVQPDSSAQVWSAAAVWHLSEASGAAVSDSAGNSLDGLAMGTEIPAPAVGIFGGSLNFDGVDDRVDFGDPTGGELDFGALSFTYECWVHVVNTSGGFDMPWYKGGSSVGNVGYDMELGTNSWRVSLADGTNIVGNSAHFGNVSNFTGRWVHLVTVVDKSTNQLRVYADGAETDTEDIAILGSVSTAIPASLSHPNYPFNGRIDEVRITGEPLTPGWVATVHENLTDGDFIEVDPPEALP